MGKVFSLVGTMCQALEPVAQGIAGLIADFVRIPIIYTVSGAFILFGGFQFATIPGIVGFLAGKSQAETPETGETVPATA